MLIRNRGEKTWHEPETTRYANEQDLENLVKESPEVIPGVPAGPAAVVTQLHVPDVGPADVVVIDVEGGITIIECKLQENPEIRRWVIGQVFSYAAGIAAMTVEDFNERWRARTAGTDIVESFSAPLPEDIQQAELLARVSANLEAGRLRLVIAVDSMTEELKRTVTFINGHSGGTFELLGLELKYVSDGAVEILVPSVFGEESAARKASGSSRGPLPDAYHQFWSDLRQWVNDERPNWMTGAQPYRDNWTELKGPIPGTVIWFLFKRNRQLAVELATVGADPVKNRATYESLFERRSDVEAAIADPVEWDPRVDKDWQRLRIIGPSGSILETEQYEAYRRWFVSATDQLWSALSSSS